MIFSILLLVICTSLIEGKDFKRTTEKMMDRNLMYNITARGEHLCLKICTQTDGSASMSGRILAKRCKNLEGNRIINKRNIIH